MKKWFNNFTGEDNGARDSVSQIKEDVSSSEAAGKPSKWMLIDKKKPWSLKKRIIVGCASVLAAALLGIGVFVVTLFVHPTIDLDPISKQSPLPGESSTPQYSDGQLVTPSPTIDPLTALIDRSDFSILEHTVNILLIGVDYAPERETWSGKKAYHSDVMIVLAINTDTNEVNMISLPRDTYADIPGVDGIYKLNASIDCGGGWPTESGFQKVCDSASWMLGGIPIKYYYAVDMTAVKGLVDKIDGVEFEVDIDFDMQGRFYKKGLQHMNGQAVLDYLRIRKDEHIEGAGQDGDLNRINRQKNMLVAIFKKLKSTGKLYNVPDIIDAFDGNLYTNVHIDQTAALAAYASNIEPENIKMHSMSGKKKNIFNWNFVITDQKKRVDLIRQIYGNAAIELYKIHQYKYMDLPAATMLWEHMQAEVVTNVSRPLLDNAKAILEADALLPVYIEPTPTPTAPTPTEPLPTPTPTESVPTSTEPIVSLEPTALTTKTYSFTPSPAPVPEGYRKYPEGGEVWTMYLRAEAAYQQLLTWDFEDTSDKHITDTQMLKNQLKMDIQTLFAKLSLGPTRSTDYWINKVWHVVYGDDKKKLKESDYNQSIVHNEIPVDFN